jgi:fatty-acyl-CoA synthase
LLPAGPQDRFISTSLDSQQSNHHRHVDLSNKSHVLGASRPPLLLADTISSNLRRTVEKYPTNPAIISVAQNKTLTYRQFLHAVENVASALLSLGVQKQDCIALWAANCLEWTIIQYATAMIGAIQVSLNPALKEEELLHALHRSTTSVVILAPEFKGESQVNVLQRVQHKIPTLRHTIVLDNELINQDIPSHWLPWKIFLNISSHSKAVLHAREQSLHPDDPINMQFTSGTTGKPKAATLSHRNVVNNGYLIGHLLAYSAVDRVCIPVPLFHCFGQVLGNLACTTHGASMVYSDPVYDPAAVLRSVQNERCSSLYGVPSQFIAELELVDFDKYDLSSLRTGIMAGAPCPSHIMRQVREKMGIKEISICFGQTETSPVSFQTRKDDSEERRVCTVGTVHPHVEACVVDPETEEIVDRGVAGELWIRGYSVMKGYWNDPEATNKTIDSQGWCHTGDLAVLDDQGYCKIVGRLKDMVLRGGECLYPREIEDFLHRNPATSDVQVFGVPDEKMGEQLCAWVKLKSSSNNNGAVGEELNPLAVKVTETDLKNWCAGKISKHKIPKYWKIVSSFPTTASGKPQKYLMRSQAIKDLGLEAVGEEAGEKVKGREECHSMQAVR